MVRDVSPHSQEKVVSQLINGICEDKDVKQSDNLVLVSANNKNISSHCFHGQLDQHHGGAQQVAGPPVSLLMC